jgi:uncharacterized linocin/CFP29 family protein
MSQLNWTEAQWNRVNSAITEEFTKASVAGACLPCYGPLGASMEAVSKQLFKQNIANPSVIKVSDNETTPFWTIRAFVELNGQQVADENLASALFAFRRAANLLARTEDYIVFMGHVGTKLPGALSLSSGTISSPPSRLESIIYNEELATRGLLTDDSAKAPNDHIAMKNHISIPKDPVPKGAMPIGLYGKNLVKAIADAIARLEDNGYPGPFACVLGHDAFLEAHTPDQNSMVLPADRITPMLGGPLLRSGVVDPLHGIVASSCGESLDLVVATAPKAQFLNVNGDAKYVFRVYERFILRIKDPDAVIPIRLA